MNEANDRQVGGNHYAAPIQHWDFVIANNVPYLEAQIMRYALRWRKKAGISDLDKAAHFLQKLREVAVAEGYPDPTVVEAAPVRRGRRGT